MALIQCPECGKQISGSAPSCPHCGYLIGSVGSGLPTPKATILEEVKTNILAGVGIIILGLIAVIAGIFTIGVIIGALFILFGFSLIVIGTQRISGMQKAYCPYCGKSFEIGKRALSAKCPICKKTSIRSGEQLNPVL